MTIGEKIRMYREFKELNQVQLAEATGINVGTIRKYELGLRNPKPEQLSKIADGLGLNVSVFYDLEINTINDIATLLFAIDNEVDLIFDGKKDNDGKYLPETVKLSFKDEHMQLLLAQWASIKEKYENYHKTGERNDEWIQKNYSYFKYVNMSKDHILPIQKKGQGPVDILNLIMHKYEIDN